MKNLWKYIGVALVAILAGFSAQAADVQVKTSGPSGQGDLIYWCPVTAVTNMVLGSNGVEVLNVEGAVAIVGDVSLTGTLTADTIEASATNITAGTVLNAVSGINVTNLNGANIASGNIALARMTNAFPPGVTLTYTNVMYDGGASSSNWVFVNGRLVTP